MSKIRTFFRFVIVAGLVFGISFGMGASLQTYLLGRTTDDDPGDKVAQEAEGKRTNILLLGTDARPGETQTRTDTIILASIDPKNDRAAIISIPRDTRIDIKGSPSDKINAANTVGGPKLVGEKVEEILGEKVDYYVEMDFRGFVNIIDALGGVDIEVDQRMYKPSEGIDLKPGQQRLNGKQALAFVRYRDYRLGDIERTAHQQVFIKALSQEILKPKNIAKLPSLVREVNRNVDTNLRLTDMLKMATWVPGFSTDSVVAQTLPGYFMEKRDEWGNLTQSYWVADQEKTSGLLEKMLAGETVAVVSQAPADSRQTSPKTNQNSTSTANSYRDQRDQEEDEEELNWERSHLSDSGHEI
ncbi:Cell envelope-related transcriptional attenuator [Syntrophomonas zehnderi OL-4]|uniref:Cell envelope-related transcriptional attenuator n=1 Tax=Syntrophomonas zehnderi OL-4 TaxID=690567 RepID=A0A0E4G9B4_9FIRM|nr:LCP family protein [Syntrophomonas zehnderi]CFX11599.1 Cell envelope-related transcriptional attenuator [Syntrophomonas zehnderi OL-4]